MSKCYRFKILNLTEKYLYRSFQVDPIDAGTDNGFTFTAPNWQTEPQGEAYRITAHYPAHPAGSFFYPYLKRLPPIGTFQFIKVRNS